MDWSNGSISLRQFLLLFDFFYCFLFRLCRSRIAFPVIVTINLQLHPCLSSKPIRLITFHNFNTYSIQAKTERNRSSRLWLNTLCENQSNRLNVSLSSLKMTIHTCQCVRKMRDSICRKRYSLTQSMMMRCERKWIKRTTKC